MDNSKLNQTELSYSSSAGLAKVNIVTGRLLYEHFDASVGLNSYNLSVSHVYNSHFDNDNHIGANWKLDIQQYLYYNQDSDTYTYIDSVGMSHTFEKLNDDNLYYDTSGMGLMLKIDTDYNTITNLIGDELVFYNEKLVKIISAENTSNVKMINYDGNKITSIYDNRNNTTKLEFEYGLYNLLSSINVFSDGLLEYSIRYYYNDDQTLSHISKKLNDGVEKIVTMFNYQNNKLEYAVAFLDKSGFKFEYDSAGKVKEIRTGIGTITESYSEETKPLLYVGDDIYLGENNYLGETYYTTIYTLQGEMEDLNTDYLSSNIFDYNENCTNVTNEKDITLTYFLDTEKKLVSVLEKVDNGYNLTQSNNGLKLSSSSSIFSSNSNIIDEQIYECSTNNGIVYNYKEDDNSNYLPNTFSFWIYLTKKLNSRYIYLSINPKTEEIDLGIEIETEDHFKQYVINPNAVNCWQQVIVKENAMILACRIENIKISFEDKNADKYVYLTNMYVSKGSVSSVQLNDGILLYDVKDVKVDKSLISDFKYLTEYDMYLTCYQKTKIMSKELETKEKEYVYGKTSFPLYYNNGTKAKFVKTAVLIMEEGFIEYVIGNQMNNDFDYKRITDNSTETSISLLENCTDLNINEKCICITKSINLQDEENTVVNAYEYYDLFNRLIWSINYDKIYQSYEYTQNGVITKIYKKIENELIELYRASKSFLQVSETFMDGSGEYNKLKYDSLTGLVNSVSEYGNLKQEYFYNKHNNLLEAIKVYGDNTDNRLNKITNSEGKVVKITDGVHIYNYEYDALGRLCLVTALNKFRLESEDIIFFYDIKKELFSESQTDIEENGEKLTEYTHINNGCENIKKYDKYGNLKEFTNNGLKATYEYEGSGFNSKLTEIQITKNGEKVEKIVYEEGINNYLNSCEDIRTCDRIDNGSPVYCRSKLVKDNNTLKYSISEQTSIDTHPNVVNEDISCMSVEITGVQQKITKVNNDISYYENGYSSGVTNTYTYDELGRVSEKNIEIYSTQNNDHYYINKYRTYDDTFPKTDKYVISSNNNELLNYEYLFENGNLKKINNKDISGDNNFISYSYDDFNRLIEENNTITGKIITYDYNANDNLSKITIDNTLDETTNQYNYIYDEDNPDLLLSCSNNGNTYSNIEYDYYGKCIKYDKNGDEYQLTWENNKYLANIKSNDVDVASYKYDYLGRRIFKTCNNGESREYFYNGNLLMFENVYTSKSKIILGYIYEQSEIIGFSLLKYNITNDLDIIDGYDCFINNHNYTYYYLKDVLGNIIGITDGTKTLVTYDYDAWGNHTINVTEDVFAIPLSKLNSITYRGYYYDVETGWFWLSSRYYSPELCRFISPDDIEYLDPESVNGLNLYCYCYNDPINYCDPSGHSAIVVGLIIGAIVGACIGFGTAAYIDYQDDGQIFNGSVAWYDYLGATVLGGAAGAAIGAGIGYIAPHIGSALSSFAAQKFTIGGGTYLAANGELVVSAGLTFTGAQVLQGASLLAEVTVMAAILGKSGGYTVKQFPNDHDPAHVHIFGDDIADKAHGIRIGIDGNPLPGQGKLPPGAKKALKKLWEKIIRALLK